MGWVLRVIGYGVRNVKRLIASRDIYLYESSIFAPIFDFVNVGLTHDACEEVKPLKEIQKLLGLRMLHVNQ